MADILIVDDDDLVRYALGKFLGRHGHSVRETANGHECLASIAQSPPDLVITDVIMPEMEGMELVRRLREGHPDLPVIAMSGGGRIGKADYLEIIEALGARAILAKPFDETELLRLIKEMT